MSTIEFLSRLRALGVTLRVEGERLRYTAAEGALTPALREELAARKPEVMSFLREAQAGAASDAAARRVRPAPREGDLPLSFAQQRLWFVQQLEPESPAYNVPVALRLAGRFEAAAMRAALAEVVRRHESLRTSFAQRAGRPVQVIHEPGEFDLPVTDLSHLNAAEREERLRALLSEEALRPFDLSAGPLLRAGVVRLSEEEHILYATMHHIVSDGWSMGVLVREVAALYEAFRRGEASPLPELPIQYADYAVWQREWLQGEILERQLSYWRERLAGAPAVLELPTDRPRPAVQTSRGAVSRFVVPADLARGLVELSRREGATLFMTLMAAWQLLLSRYSGQTDIVVGTPVANRRQGETESLIGFFVNNLAIRTRIDPDQTFRQLLAQVRETALEAQAHQDVPFEMLVEELAPERSLSHAPLYQVDFTMQDEPLPDIELAGLRLSPVHVLTGTAKFDLMLNFIKLSGEMSGFIEYNTDLFDEARIRRLAGHFLRLLESVTADPSRRLAELSMLGEDERRLLLEDWARSPADYPRQLCVHELFEAEARRSPEATALEAGGERLTYGELDGRSTALAGYLRALGVGAEVPVALCVERSTQLVVGMLGILKAGGLYVPLDPQYPAERLSFMLEDSRAPVLLTQDSLLDSLPAGMAQVVCLDTDWEMIEAAGAYAAEETAASRVTPDGLAYLIYTSGSTGRPKGVAVTHRGIARLVKNSGFASFDASETFLQLAPASFDASTFEIWGALLNGARLVVMPPGQPTIVELGEALRRHQVTTLWLTAGLFHLVVEENVGVLRPLRQLLAGGDVLAPGQVERALRELPGCRLVNGYGPTENTTFTCCHRMEEGASFVGASVPIGRPVGNTEVYILDAEMRPAPVGVAGELYTGGDGLARGYWGRPALTAERFVPHPFSTEPGARLYRTGDLARWREGGLVEFVGRGDRQVKVRGYRIELGEVEAALARHGAVAEAAVEARAGAGGDKRLVGYVRLRDGAEVSAAELRRHLSERVPEYMVPGAIVVMEEWPLTPNGKLERRALPDPEAVRAEAEEAYVAPRTRTEARLAAIWAEVLGRERVGVRDNFFDLGGHSLLATQVLSKVRELLGVETPLRAMFEEPTVEGLARQVEARLGEGEESLAPPIEPAPREGDLPLSFAQQRLWFVQQLEPESPAYNVPVALRLAGRFEAAAMRAALAEVVRRHESLRTSFAQRAGRPVQVIHEPGEFDLPVTELRGAGEGELQALLTDEALRPFDLSAGPLLRAGVVRLSEEEHVLYATMHHIVSDGWSMGVLVREVAALYEAFRRGEASPLPELSIQYADYAVWQRRWLQGEALERQLSYWRAQLAGVPVLELPTDRPRPAAQTFRGEREPFALSPELSAALAALSQREGVTLYMTLLAAFKALLARYTGQEDLAVGSAIANRNHPGVEDLIGFFVNMLVLRTDLSGDPTFTELLGRVRETALEAYAHQDVPFEKLVEELQPERDLSRSPFFSVVFQSLNNPMPALEFSGLRVTPLEVQIGMPHFDLILTVIEGGADGLVGSLEYNTDLFDEATARRMLNQFEALLAAVAERPGRRLLEIPLGAGRAAAAPAAATAPPPVFADHQFTFELD